MKFKLLPLILLLWCGVISAKEFKSPPPVELLLLEYKKVLDGEPLKGSHGLRKYCYKTNDIYVVYSENLMGDGYSFLTDKPKQKCISSKSNISTNNKLGLTVGISQQKASDLVGIKLAEGDNEIFWDYQRPIHNLPYDDMTTLNITIKNGLVYAVTLFNVVAS
jgi:hypothetical protein